MERILWLTLVSLLYTIQLTSIQPSKGKSRVRRAFGRNGSQWKKTNGVLIIPYVIDFPKDSWQYTRIKRAIEEINSYIACNPDAWRPRKQEMSYVVFRKSKDHRCNSNVGQVNIYWQPQTINLPDWCIFSSAIFHEMMHAMGFWHELDRPDRHKYIDIRMENVQPGREKRFKRMKPDNPFGPFGYRSIMMVHEFAYSKKKKQLRTIEAQDWRYQRKMRKIIREKNGLSKLDKEMLNIFYNCTHKKKYVYDNMIEVDGCKEWDWCETAVKFQEKACIDPQWQKACSISCDICVPKSRKNVPMDGNWGAWGARSSCSATCGMGFKEMARSCNRPPPRNGGLKCLSGNGLDRVTVQVKRERCERRKCNMNGGWTRWRVYSCSRTCGGGVQKMSRTCTNPRPTGTGHKCRNNQGYVRFSDKKTVRCNTRRCPVNGGWSEWEVYPCTRSCGPGHQTKIRTCTSPRPSHNGLKCLTTSGLRRYREKTKQHCNARRCPIDGGWTRWNPYTSCSRGCGGGTQKQVRTCDNPRPSGGGRKCRTTSGYRRLTERRKGRCNAHSCVAHGGWSEWNVYSCSELCGGGMQLKTRTCTEPRPRGGGLKCLTTNGHRRSREKRFSSCNTRPCDDDQNGSGDDRKEDNTMREATDKSKTIAKPTVTTITKTKAKDEAIAMPYHAIFHNNCNQVVELIWEDESGKEIIYNHLDPGKKLAQMTYSGHYWRARGSSYRRLMHFVRDDVRGERFEGTKFGVSKSWDIINVSIVPPHHVQSIR